ncbi:MAG: divergent polysaccharide deacetylase family protein [Pseudomonadota bacterium]
MPLSKSRESYERRALKEVRAYRSVLQEAPFGSPRRRRARWPLIGILVVAGIAGGVLVERTAERLSAPAPMAQAPQAVEAETAPLAASMRVVDARPLADWQAAPEADFDLEGGLAVTRKVIAPAAPEPAPEPMVAAGEPQWQANAVARTPDGGRPMIAIVLDDLGLNRPGARRAIALPAPMTLAFMTYAERLPALTEKARAAGHELLVHVPMEPESRSEDPGLNALLTGLDPATLRQRLDWGLGRFTGYVGINNHMGSRFTSQPEGMRQVFSALRARGLMFLDSKTTAGSVARDLAAEYQVAYVARDVFLDNTYESRESIRRQLAKLEKIAVRKGSAIGLGHPHRTTLEELARWVPEMRARGFELVPVSAVAQARRKAGPSS